MPATCRWRMRYCRLARFRRRLARAVVRAVWRSRLSIGELNVTAHNADPQEIAQAIVGGELARQVRALVEQSDSRVRV